MINQGAALDFGPHRIDRHNRILSRAGIAGPLGGRAFDTLLALAEPGVSPGVV